MSGSHRLLHERLPEILLEDQGIKGWAQGNFGRELTLIRGNRMPEHVTHHERPALMIVQDEGENALMTMANSYQRPSPSVIAGFFYRENDSEKAYWQAVNLVDVMIRALMNNPTLYVEADQEGRPEAVDQAFVSDFVTDRGDPGTHPNHWVRFTVTAEYTLEEP